MHRRQSLPNEEFATKDSELLACDVECRLAGVDGFYLELDIPGLDELIGGGHDEPQPSSRCLLAVRILTLVAMANGEGRIRNMSTRYRKNSVP